MDATTGATIVASVINSSSLNCSSSSSSNSSSGYGSSHSAASTPIGSQYETATHTPVSAASEHVPPTATVAPVTPCYSETTLSQQQRQQYYQSYAYPSSASQYPIYDAFTGNSYHNLTTPSVERTLGLGTGSNGSSSSSSTSGVGSHLSAGQQQRLEKLSKSAATSSGTQLYTSSASSSLTTTTSSTTKPQATAPPFFVQPSSNVSGSSTAYYDAYGKYKMPSSAKLPSHAATDYANYQHAVASLSYQQQQQHYYAAAKSQLQDVNYAAAVKPHRQHSVNNASTYYGNSGAYYDKYEKYMYPPTASGATYGTAAPTHATHPYSPHEPTTADPYRKAAAAAAANTWHWNMEYAATNCRNLPPTAPAGSYLTAGSTSSSARDAFCAASNDKYSKYDKYSAYYASAHHQQYMTPQSTAASSRNLWSNTAHHTPHLASVQHGLNDRLSHTLPPSATQHQYPHTHPHSSHHHFAATPTAAPTAQRQSCCAQPFQQQSCYYPRSSQQHAPSAIVNPYAPPQQSHYSSNNSSSTSGSHKYGAYSNSFKSNTSSNDLFVTSPFDTTPPPAYNYGTASATSLPQRYGTSNAAFYNDLSLQTAFDGFANTAPMLPQHNVAAHSTHLGYQTHGSSQNPGTGALLDYRKPTAVASNDYCLGKSRAPPLTAMESHIGPASYAYIHGNPIAQPHPVITSPTSYDGGSSSEKSTPTTKNIRDFLATWSEGEDEEGAAAANAAEQLSYVEGAPVQLQSNRIYSLPELDSCHEEMHARKQLGVRPKIHVGITVDGSLDVDSSQFINLPDIVIDIEKPNTASTPATGAVTPAEVATTPRNEATLMEQHSPCDGHSHEIFENFDVEKELDELQIKRAKLCLEKQLNNEIRILTPEPPNDSQNCEVAAAVPKQHEQQTTPYQNISECEKSYQRGDTFLKEMELNDSTSHSSNGSTFEKEYETFINRIENDKIDVERHNRVTNEADTNATQMPIINEDSGSVSHQSSGIKTPPDPSDIDELAQKACQSVKPLNFSGNPDFETREHEDFGDCVQDLTIHASMDMASQKSMDDSMVLQNFEGPSEEMVVIAENLTTTAVANVTEKPNEASAPNVIQPEDLSLSRDGLFEEKKSNVEQNKRSPTRSPESTDDLQNKEDFSIFYKKKRKLVQDLQENESVQLPTKQSKPSDLDHDKKDLKEESKPSGGNVDKFQELAGKSKKIAKNKRRPLSFFYKNLRHWTNARKAKMQVLVQQQLALLKERHLPLIKRKSIKNLSDCEGLVYNPSSLKCLTVSIVNTDEFQNHILDEKDTSPNLKVESEKREAEAMERSETVIVKNTTSFIEKVEGEQMLENDANKVPEEIKFVEADLEKVSAELLRETVEETQDNANDTNDNDMSAEIDSTLTAKLDEVFEANTAMKTSEMTPVEILNEVSSNNDNERSENAEIKANKVDGELEPETNYEPTVFREKVTEIVTELDVTDESQSNECHSYANDEAVVDEPKSGAEIHSAEQAENFETSIETIKKSPTHEVEEASTKHLESSISEVTEAQVPVDHVREAEIPRPQSERKEENLKDALEEQSSTTVSDNWSTSLKAQEDFNGFEEESNSKHNLSTSSNSLSETVDENKLQSMTVDTVDEPLEEAVQTTKANKLIEPEKECSVENTTAFVPNETDSSAQAKENRSSTEPPTQSVIILDSDTEPEIVSAAVPTDADEVVEPKFTPQTSPANYDSNVQSIPLPPMRTKASVKMCDFSAIRLKRIKFQERKKSKTLNKDKDSPTSTPIYQKPNFKGIGNIDKTEFVESWAASVSTGEKRRGSRTDSIEALDLSPTSRFSSAKTSPIPPDENSNSSSTSSSSNSSSSSDSSCDKKSQASSSSSTSSQTTQTSKTSTTSSTSQSSSSDSSSDFNELKALERELSQHKTHDDWASSVAQMCEAENGDANKTDKIKLEIFETEATNQDIEDLKKILESESEDTTEQEMPNMTTKDCVGAEEEVCVEAAESKEIASLKDLAEEFITRQAAKLREKQMNELATTAFECRVIPKLSDLCKIALNSSFVVNDLKNVNQNQKENENKDIDLVEVKEAAATENQQHHQNNITPPNSPKSTTNERQHQSPQQQPPAMTVEEQLAEMYRQAGVASDPEDNNMDDAILAGENYTENHAQDYLLINLAEILANSDNESNVFVLQCDMNENILRVMTTSPSSDNSNELVIGEVANVDVESSSAVQIVQLVNAEDLQVVAPPPLPSLSPPPPPHSPPPPPPRTVDITPASPLEQYIDSDHDSNNDLPIIHHEEIVPDNYKKYQKEQLLKYLHAKYVQKHVKRFYHAHRISKKYRRRYLTKKVAVAVAVAATVANAQRARS